MKFLFISLILVFSISCSRPGLDTHSASVSITMPKKSELMAKVIKLNEALPSNKTYCFAVNVKGSGIEENMGMVGRCQASVGVSAGFVPDGDSLTLEIPKGTGREFELFLYLAEPGTICPAFNSSYLSIPEAYLRTYQVGKAVGVDLTQDNESVSINLDFRGISQNLLADLGQTSCLDEDVVLPSPEPFPTTTPIVTPEPTPTITPVVTPEPTPTTTPIVTPEPSPTSTPTPTPTPPRLRALLFSDGSIVEAGIDTSILSKSWIESFFILLVDVFDLSHIEAIGNASNSVQDLMTAGGIAVPPYLHSFSTDPISGDLYALGEGGDIYKVSKVDGSLLNFTCPFSSCQLPMWVQSISVGTNGKLYALDHAGQIYELQATGLALLTDAVSPAVMQVLYY